MLAATRKSVSAPTARVASTSAAPRPVVCRAQKGEENDAVRKAVALPLAGLVAAALMTSAFVPDEALAARSAGRSGGSSGFQSRRSAPSSAAAPQMRSSTTVVSPSVVVSSPPVFSPFGFGGGYGYGYAPAPIFSPFGIGLGFGFGGFFQIFFLLATVSIVFSVIKGIADAAGRAANKNDKNSQDDDWGKL